MSKRFKPRNPKSKATRPAVLPIFDKPLSDTVIDLSHDAQGVIRLSATTQAENTQTKSLLTPYAGKSVLLENALPDEQVEFVIKQSKAKHFIGSTLRIIEKSPYRQTPFCTDYAHCGGCNLQHLQAQKARAFKQQQLYHTLLTVGQCDAKTLDKAFCETLFSEDNRYRTRARLHVNEQGEIGFFAAASHQLTAISQCAILLAPLSALLTTLAKHLPNFKALKEVECIYIAQGDDGQTSAHFALGDSARFMAQNQQAIADLTAVAQVSFCQATRQLLHYRLDDLTLNFYADEFTQANRALNQAMVAQAINWLSPNAQTVVLDLFCGLGNFSLPLAKQAKQVIGLEGAAHAVLRATENAAQNQLHNTAFYTVDLSTPPATNALFLREKIDSVLLDPPRAGAAALMPFLKQLAPQQICYVSCHVATLARDLALLQPLGYRLKRVNLMDMFASTTHIEAMVLLEKRRLG